MEIQDFINFRKELHQYPELSGKENKTKQKILLFTKQFQADKIIEVGKTGIILYYKGNVNSDKAILIRAELDALPIQEINDFAHASKIPNVSHKCGHDGHSVILCRLAYLLQEHREDYANVYLLFQPAEENGKGAKEVYEDPKFKNIALDTVIALHNIPGFPLHQVLLKRGAMTPAVRSMIIKFKGKTSHAAEPELGNNPAKAMAEFMLFALNQSNNDTKKEDFFLVTPVYTEMGEKSYGVSAGYGEVHITIRTWETALLYEKSEFLSLEVAKIAKQNNLDVAISWTEEFEANKNDEKIIDLVEDAAKELKMSSTYLKEPRKWGEDFGLFTNHFQGAMFGIGSGLEQAALHNPDYDFPDEIIESASNLFLEIIKNYFHVGKKH